MLCNFVEKLFFNKGLTNYLIPLGQADRHDFLPEKTSTFFQRNNGLLFFAVVNLENIAGVQNNLDFFWHNSEPSY